MVAKLYRIAVPILFVLLTAALFVGNWVIDKQGKMITTQQQRIVELQQGLDAANAAIATANSQAEQILAVAKKNKEVADSNYQVAQKCQEDYAQLAIVFRQYQTQMQRGQMPAELLKLLAAFFL